MSHFCLGVMLGIQFTPPHQANKANGHVGIGATLKSASGINKNGGKEDGKPTILLAGCSGWDMTMGFVAVPSQEMGMRVW